jgi:hypothetical protein
VIPSFHVTPPPSDFTASGWSFDGDGKSAPLFYDRPAPHYSIEAIPKLQFWNSLNLLKYEPQIGRIYADYQLMCIKGWSRSAPAGGENPQGFHPFANPFQFLPKISGEQTEHPLMAVVCAMHGDPCGRAMPP